MVEVLTKQFLANPTSDSEDRAKLEAFFTRAAASVPEAKVQMLASPRMADVVPRADQLVELSQTAKEALGYLSSGTKAPAGWKAKSMAQIDDAKKPVALIRFTFIAPLSDLVQAVRE